MDLQPGIKIGLVAGEASGDILGGGLLRAIKKISPGYQAVGVAGDRMVAAGCQPLIHCSELAVMGLVEVLSHLPRLLKLRKHVARQISDWRPDVFVGIDAPAFNLGLEAGFRRQGIPTVQYVSPAIWAWRSGRVKKITRSADLVLCLLPFEKQFYDDHDIQAEFVGHPLAEEIAAEADPSRARQKLGLPAAGEYLALLPGSRTGEVSRLAGDFASAVAWLNQRRPALRYIAAMASPDIEGIFSAAIKQTAPGADVRLYQGHSRTVMAASDAVLLASGTAALEAALLGRPMVVTYRLARVSRWLLSWPGLLRTEKFSLPNLISGEDLVPEIFQGEISPESLGQAVLNQLDDHQRRTYLQQKFADIHRLLKRNASQRAAEAVLALASRGRQSRSSTGGA